MPEFIVTYHGGKKLETQDEQMELMAQWKSWAQGLGAALTNPGTPVGITKVMTAKGVSNDPSPHPIMGFSIVVAADMDAALDLIKDCPHFDIGGTMEVSEMMQMQG